MKRARRIASSSEDAKHVSWERSAVESTVNSKYFGNAFEIRATLSECENKCVILYVNLR